MKKVTLLFPDHLAIADFVLSEKVRDVELDSNNPAITAVLTLQDIAIALERYGAVIHPSNDYI